MIWGNKRLEDFQVVKRFLPFKALSGNDFHFYFGRDPFYFCSFSEAIKDVPEQLNSGPELEH